jgi:hypothetical protein
VGGVGVFLLLKKAPRLVNNIFPQPPPDRGPSAKSLILLAPNS